MNSSDRFQVQHFVGDPAAWYPYRDGQRFVRESAAWRLADRIYRRYPFKGGRDIRVARLGASGTVLTATTLAEDRDLPAGMAKTIAGAA